MAKVTIVFALLLIVVGLVGYFGASAAEKPAEPAADAASEAADAAESPKRSVTALIPAFAGGLLLLCGVAALNEKARMHAMHAAVLVGLLGFLAAGGRGAMGLMKLLSDDADVNRRSLAFVGMMALLCGVYVVLCVNSFIQARRRRKTGLSEE